MVTKVAEEVVKAPWRVLRHPRARSKNFKVKRRRGGHTMALLMTVRRMELTTMMKRRTPTMTTGTAILKTTLRTMMTVTVTAIKMVLLVVIEMAT